MRTLSLGVGLLLSLVLGEIVLRAIGYEYSPLHVAAGRKGDRRDHHILDDAHFTYDPELFWRPRPGHGIFNGQGFRGPELGGSKPRGEFRVFAVGDSNTLGWGGKRGAYNVSGDQGVELELRGGNRIMIGSQRADALAEAISAQRQNKILGMR